MLPDTDNMMQHYNFTCGVFPTQEQVKVWRGLSRVQQHTMMLFLGFSHMGLPKKVEAEKGMREQLAQKGRESTDRIGILQEEIEKIEKMEVPSCSK